MAFNPNNPKDISRLREHIDSAEHSLVVARQNRTHAIRQSVGKHYSQFGTSRRTPLNLINMAENVYMRKLAARRPRVHIGARVPHLKSYAHDLTEDTNRVLKRMNFGVPLRRAVKAAWYSIGILKLTVEPGEEAARQIGDVSLDDWFHDPHARHTEEATFMGDGYWMAVEDIRENESFKKEVREAVIATDQTGDYASGEAERAEEVGKGREMLRERYQPQARLKDVWLPREKLLVTLGPEGPGSTKPLGIIEWEGPERGAYHILGFSEVLDCALPMAPVQIAMDLHELVNQLVMKMGIQAGNQKTIYGYMGEAEEEVNELMGAKDQATIPLTNPDAIKIFQTAGVDQKGFAFMLQMKELFSWLMGNLDMLGGLGPQSETLGQDQLLSAAASERLADMQAQTIEFARGVIHDIAWWEWHDPIKLERGFRLVRGTDQAVPYRISRPDHRGRFPDYEFDIAPYSMQDRSPAQRLQIIIQLLQQVFIPLLPTAQQQGMMLQVPKLAGLVSELADLTEFEDLFVFAGEQPMLNTELRPSQPQMSHRTYERVNRPGATAGGHADMIGRMMFGGGLQNAEAASLARNVG